MPLSLSPPLSTYFEISNGSESIQVADCFTADAVVIDEGQMHRGHDAIHSWKCEARKKYNYTVEPIDVSTDGNILNVKTLVVGNFPGSPAQLDHVFRLLGNRIQLLEIR